MTIQLTLSCLWIVIHWGTKLSPFCYAWFQANLNTISRQNTHHFKRVQTETQAALMRKTTNKSNKALKANKLLNCKNAYMFAPMEQLPCSGTLKDL